MNRIEAKMKALQEKGEKAFITYITAGLPDLEGTKKLLKAQEKSHQRGSHSPCSPGHPF